jgi:hypothetical protein
LSSFVENGTSTAVNPLPQASATNRLLLGSACRAHAFATRLVVTIGLIVLFAGCATTNGQRKLEPDLLAFLEDGHTVRSEVLERLGEPSSRLLRDAVICYRLHGDASRGFRVVPVKQVASIADDKAVRWSLVLTFDAEGKLMRHALVGVR